MSDLILPAQASLEQLKKQAKELLDSITQQNADAVALFGQHHPVGLKERQAFALHDAQLVLARRYGFLSWSKLKEEVERRASDFPGRLRKFVLDALSGNPQIVRRALQVEPELAKANLWSLLVTGDVAGIRDALNKGSAWVTQRGGPRENWIPLHYVCFSRLQMENADAKQRFTECAKLLLDAGADPNLPWEDSRWPGAPLRPLYGATGVNDNPALARCLLERGADVDDGESIYHAAESYHLACMEVLKEFGVSLGWQPHWKNTPLYFLLETGSPDSGNWTQTRLGVRWLLDQGSDLNIPCGPDGETALHAAIKAGHHDEIIGWLLDAGSEVNQLDKNGIAPMILAHRLGRKSLVEILREHGAREVKLTPREQFFQCAFGHDRDGMQRLLSEHPALTEAFSEDDRLALNRAAEQGQVEAARLLLDAGFDIAFKGAKDWGSTPLHIAAWRGWADMVDLLLARGAPLDVLANKPEESLPLGWAAHGSNFYRNPRGDYPRIVRAMLAAGAKPLLRYADMGSPEVAEVLYSALAGDPAPA